jgi:hypothetical protein
MATSLFDSVTLNSVSDRLHEFVARLMIDGEGSEERGGIFVLRSLRISLLSSLDGVCS